MRVNFWVMNLNKEKFLEKMMEKMKEMTMNVEQVLKGGLLGLGNSVITLDIPNPSPADPTLKGGYLISQGWVF